MKELCWVCDGMPVAKACASCLGKASDPMGKDVCSRCHGHPLTAIKCPACNGSRYSPPPRRNDPEWADPVECTTCHGMPLMTATGGCEACGNRGRLYLVFPETDYVTHLRQCPCVASLEFDAARGVVPGCLLCGGFGVMYIVRRMFCDAQVANHFLVNPPPDLAYAYLTRTWGTLAAIAPPLWPWEDAAARGGAA